MCEFSCGLELLGMPYLHRFLVLLFFSLSLIPQIYKDAESRSYDTNLVEKPIEKNDLECIAKRNC